MAVYAFRYGMHITHVCTELSPIMECGTLGGFVLDLSKAMQRRGNLIDVILPK
jgi:glycogen synthase